MRILHVIAQKPHSTGSGVYLSGMVEGFKEMGHEQALIAGLHFDEVLPEKEREIFQGMPMYPLRYQSKELNFHVLGMSDVMPYPSTKYRDMSPEMVQQFRKEFTALVCEAVEDFCPDMIISHHLYLSTAILRDIIPPEIRLMGICHGTCMRQLQSHGLESDYIRDRVGKLDWILALHEEQKALILKTFSVSEAKVSVIGSGFDNGIFYDQSRPKPKNPIEIVYTGKMSRSKGVFSLMKALEQMVREEGLPQGISIRLRLIGGGNNQERHDIQELAESCSYRIDILGRLETQEEIADIYSESHIFVLPSFYEGLPLVINEAMACGMEVVTTDIPGVKPWIESVLGDNHRMTFVPLPKMEKVDMPFEEELPPFEKRLSLAIREKISKILSGQTLDKKPDMEKLSWKGLCERIENIIKYDIMIEKFFRNLEEILGKDDRVALYNLMDESFRQRVSLEHFTRLDKYQLHLGRDLRVEKIYPKTTQENNKENLQQENFMVRISHQQETDRQFANMFLSEHNGDLKIAQFLYQRD